MDQGIRRSQRDYRLAFKLSVVEQVEKGDLTYKHAQKRYGIQGQSVVFVPGQILMYSRLGERPETGSTSNDK